MVSIVVVFSDVTFIGKEFSDDCQVFGITGRNLIGLAAATVKTNGFDCGDVQEGVEDFVGGFGRAQNGCSQESMAWGQLPKQLEVCFGILWVGHVLEVATFFFEVVHDAGFRQFEFEFLVFRPG